MSGYRDMSGFDPNAGGELGPPLRPFNKWQWLGVAMLVAGALVMFAALASRFGWLPATKDDWIPMSSSLVIFGSVLVNSRRSHVSLSPETRRRRLLIVLVAAALCALAAVLIFYFKGA
jgi:uncharacterized membrane protein YdcZ (DUF606 family)